MPSRKNLACWMNLLVEENESLQVMRYGGAASSPRTALVAAAYADDEARIPIPVSLSPERGLGEDTAALGDGTSSAPNSLGVAAPVAVELTGAMRQVTLRPERALDGQDASRTTEEEREH